MKTVLWAPDNDHSLNPLTRLLPKPLVPVLNRPMLEFYFLQAQEVRSSGIFLLIDAGNKRVEYHFKKIRNRNNPFAISLIKDSSPSPLNALYNLQSRLNKTFMFVDTRVFSLFNWSNLLEKHRQSGAIMSVVYLPFNPVKGLSVVTVDGQNHLKAIEPIMQSEADRQMFVLTNCFFFEPAIFKYLQNKSMAGINADLIPFLLSEGMPVNAIRAEGLFEPLGSLYYYWRLNLDLLESGELKYLPDVRALAKGIWVGKGCSFKSRLQEDIIAPVLIGNHSKVGRTVTIRGPAIVGNHVKLSKDAIVDRSIILDHTYIGKAVEVKDSIIAQNCYISVHKVFGTFIEEDFILSEYRPGNWAFRLQRYFWAIFDRLLAISFILFLFPIFLLIAFLIKLESGGSVFVTELCRRNQYEETDGSDHYRYLRENDIKFYRFRTVYIKGNSISNKNERKESSEDKVKQKTCIGRFLQKTNLVNLPILMSIALWGTKVLQCCEKQTKMEKPITLLNDAGFDPGFIQELLSLKGHLRLWRQFILNSMNIGCF